MIDTSDVRHIATLARLDLEASELATYAGQMDRILGFFGELAAIDTTDVPMATHPLPLPNTFRADVPHAGLGVEAVLAAAPAPEGPYFRVPKILDSANG